MIETEETAEKINEGFQDWSKEAYSIFCLNTRRIQQLSISLSHSSSDLVLSFHLVLLTRAGQYIDIYLNSFTCSDILLYPLSHYIQLWVIIYYKCHYVNIL